MASKLNRLTSSIYQAATHVGENLDMTEMIDKNKTSENLEEKLGQIFGKHLVSEFPHIGKDRDYSDFCASIGQSIFDDMQEAIGSMINPDENSPTKTSFADTAVLTIESALEEFDISIT